ncbi:MAG: ATP-binding protein [Elusimicrobiota bacterium]|nr:ATP-binding protein [Elusimicrobiota bacterium]
MSNGRPRAALPAVRAHQTPARPAAPAARRLETLYEIGRVLLAPFESVEEMNEGVLKLVVKAIPLRGVILVEKRDARVRLHVWRSPRENPERLRALKNQAEGSFARVTGLPAMDVEERESVLKDGAEAGARAVAAVVIPLALRGGPSFGIVQVEPARRLDEADMAFVNTAVDHISIALDRFYGRLRETALREQAEQAEKEARRVNANLERLVAERTVRLERTVKDLHSFAYSIAHDLRAPLRHIHGYCEFLVAGADERSRPHAQRIMAATRRMDQLIEDLLFYSRLTLEDVKTEPMETSDVLARVIAGLDAEIKERQALLDIEAPLPRVLGHAVPLTQIFANLLSNALKFVPRGVSPRIKVRSELRGNLARFTVEDNGIGIDAAHQEKIFDVFLRLHSSDEYPGTGIGLAIVRRAAERLGGTAGVESAPGRGSRFWVELKRAI